jgi:hypothetical protein
MDMRTLNEIRDEIDRLSARRGEVMRALSEGFDATLKSEHLELEEQIAELWDEQRQSRAAEVRPASSPERRPRKGRLEASKGQRRYHSPRSGR